MLSIRRILRVGRERRKLGRSRFTLRSHRATAGKRPPGSVRDRRYVNPRDKLVDTSSRPEDRAPDDLQGRIHLDRRHRADGHAALEDQDRRRRRPSSPSGASTARAPTRPPATQSDCVLQPVFSCPDPIRGGDNMLVLCEVLHHRHDPAPHQHPCRVLPRSPASSRTRSRVRHRAGVHVLQGRPSARLPPTGFPAPQGRYYCGVGADEVYGRDIVEAHLDACLTAGLHISGINAEVMPGQWEFQVGPLARSRWPTSCGWRAGCSTGSPRTSASPRHSTPSRSPATGTAPAPTPTSRPTRCGRATTP